MTLLMVGGVKFMMFLTENAFIAKFGANIPHEFFLYLLPVALAPMLVGLLIQAGEVVWLFTAFVAVAMGVVAVLVATGGVPYHWGLLIGAGVAGLVELAPLRLDDNLTIPLLSGAAMRLSAM